MLCAVGVVVLTAALLFVLRPRDDAPSSPPVSVPLPTEEPTDLTFPPDESLLPETPVPEPDTGVPEAPPAP